MLGYGVSFATFVSIIDRKLIFVASIKKRWTKDRDRDRKMERPGRALLWTFWRGLSVFVVSFLGSAWLFSIIDISRGTAEHVLDLVQKTLAPSSML